MNKEEIINKIERKTSNYYINIAKEYLEQYGQFSRFEKAILSELISLRIEKHYSIEECFFYISQEYNVNCKKIIFDTIVKAIKMPTIQSKFLFWTNKDEVIFHCLNILKNQVVEIAYTGKRVNTDDTTKKIERMQEQYHNIPVVDIMKELSNKSIEIIRKLCIKLENKVYTEYEFDILEGEVSDYYIYEGMTEEEKSVVKSLNGTGVAQEEVTEVLNEMYKISEKHGF